MSNPEKVGPCQSTLRFRSQGGLASCVSLTDADDLLGGAIFGAPADLPIGKLLPMAQLPTPILSGEVREGEFWLGGNGDSGIIGGEFGALRYRHDGRFLFGLITLDESDFVDRAVSPLQMATEFAYQQTFQLMKALAYPNLARCWNYLAAINDDENGLERYRHFNIGRQQAFADFSRAVAGHVPAACALGVATGPLTVFFLASREPAIAVENPRQVSAYHYPAEYGPRPPTFARAAVLPLQDRSLLMVSGTASIVGHQTLHVGDAREQARESLANIEAVIAESNRVGRGAIFAKEHLDYRVYLRNSDDLHPVQQIVDACLRSSTQPARVIYLQADVCRRELLVELEATGYSLP